MPIARYNSGRSTSSKRRTGLGPPDRTDPSGSRVDEKVLKDILQWAASLPGEPLRVPVLPAEILGHVYEQFLGQVIRLTEGHHARIEEQARGAARWRRLLHAHSLVEYIVRRTLGKLLEGKTPAGRAARVLDPACGSGSFLIGAYQFLLDWHLQAIPRCHGQAAPRDRLYEVGPVNGG